MFQIKAAKEEENFSKITNRYTHHLGGGDRFAIEREKRKMGAYKQAVQAVSCGEKEE